MERAREFVYCEFIEPDLHYHFYNKRQYAERVCNAICMTLGFVVLYEEVEVEKGIIRFRMI